MATQITASELRKQVLNDHAAEVIRCFMIRATTGQAVLGSDPRMLEKAFDRIMTLVEKASDPVSGLDMKDKSISERIDEVLTKVADGSITPSEGKRVISLLSAGFEMTELAELVARLEAVEKK